MALDVLVTTDRIKSDPVSRTLIDHLRTADHAGSLDEGSLYYDFPTYADYETVAHKPDILLVSKRHGILAVRILSDQVAEPPSPAFLEEVDESLGQFCSILIGRLIKSKSLRRSLSALTFDVTPVVFSQGGAGPLDGLEISKAATSLGAFDQILAELDRFNLSADALSETRSVVEGAKALARPQKRLIKNPQQEDIALALSSLEAEIANFDQRQRKAALIAIAGPQRIRGLAGSGKTVIIAMKAAHLHMTNPEAAILVTFLTKSLRETIKNLITKFYRHYREEDPNWELIHIRHGWGGSSEPGTYYDTCRRERVIPFNFSDARARAGRGITPFNFACHDLLARTKIRPVYDHVLIDEGQDFPDGFYQLCFFLAKGERDEKSIVWAYDELQNIMDVAMRSPEALYGVDASGEPRVSLDRTSGRVPPGGSNDTVLSKCYRNQREVLLTAHALGFGIYGNIVQLLESSDHWEDVGYEVEENRALEVGKTVRILRPLENSPASLATSSAGGTIETFVADDMPQEVEWVAAGIERFIRGGLNPEDILVVALDDRNARRYLKDVSVALALRGLQSNNITADPYSEPPFSIPAKVTLSTVYRAKGNEAAVVFALGVDAVSTQSKTGRNKLFTAFTRTKAWLRVSGIGFNGTAIVAEIGQALKAFPELQFVMPDLSKVELIERDFSERQARAKRIKDKAIKDLKQEGLSDEEIADLMME